jgi:hypothetical protein
MTDERPGVETLPTEADTAVARAVQRLRPAGLPWPALAPAAHRNLAIAAQPLRRALEREGWTAANELAAESAAIANRGCSCTDDQTCWDHEALEMRAEHQQAVTRRLRWEIFHEGGIGVLVTDLDTEQWASGSAATELEARRLALRNLNEHPSGGKRDPRWAGRLDAHDDPRVTALRAGWQAIEQLVGREYCTPESTIDAVRVLVEQADSRRLAPSDTSLKG